MITQKEYYKESELRGKKHGFEVTYDVVSQLLLNKVNKFLSMYNIKYGTNLLPTVSSGYREPAYNKKIGGADNSLHTLHRAIDLRDDSKQSLCNFYESLTYAERQDLGLSMEAKEYTKGKYTPWIHLDDKARPIVCHIEAQKYQRQLNKKTLIHYVIDVMLKLIGKRTLSTPEMQTSEYRSFKP